MPSEHTLTLKQARRILGTRAKEYSDDELLKMMAQIEALSDIVIANIDGSKIKRGIDIRDRIVHT